MSEAIKLEIESLKNIIIKKEEELKLQEKLEVENSHQSLVDKIENEYKNFQKNHPDLIINLKNTQSELKEIESKMLDLTEKKEKLLEEFELKKCPNLYQKISDQYCINRVLNLYTSEIVTMDYRGKKYITADDVLNFDYECKCYYCK